MKEGARGIVTVVIIGELQRTSFLSSQICNTGFLFESGSYQVFLAINIKYTENLQTAMNQTFHTYPIIQTPKTDHFCPIHSAILYRNIQKPTTKLTLIVFLAEKKGYSDISSFMDSVGAL